MKGDYLLMGKLKEFLICEGCSASLEKYFEDQDLAMWCEENQVMYKCPLCETINKSKPLEEN